MAEGYSRRRPPLHSLIVSDIARCLGSSLPVARALDVGCGSGLSTAALVPFASMRIGIDPTESMLGWARNAAPGCVFAAGCAERLSLASSSIDLITAAGSLNYADLAAFFAEARRVLTDGGIVAVYDFATGREFADAGGLNRWFDEFVQRYPFPPYRVLISETLREAGQPWFDAVPRGSSRPQYVLTMTRDQYLEYMMTETNVAAAISAGAREADVRSWCAETLATVFDGRDRPIRFHAQFDCLRLRSHG